MGLFPWKKKDDGSADKGGSGSNGTGGGSGGKSGGNGAGGAGGGGFEYSPEKSGKFFERAAQMHEATNFSFAMNLWLRGLRMDPTAMSALEGFFKSAASYFTENPKGEKDESYKSTAKEFHSRSDLDKYLLSLLEWSAHPAEATYAVKAMQNADALGLASPATWIAQRVTGAVMRDKKPRKDHMIAAMATFKKFDKFEEAVQAGEAAMRIDPLDGKLSAEVKNLSAEWTTKRGGFDQQGQEGGFRSNIRDATKQRQLEEQGRVVTTEEGLDRLVALARADYETSPNDRPNAIKFIDTLLRRAKTEDEDEAMKVAETWHEKSQEFRFREYADTIRVRKLRRRAAALKAEAAKPEASEEAKAAATAAAKDWIKAEVRALEGQVAAYPTDLTRKYELAKKYYQVGKHEEAIGLLQEASADLKIRPHAQQYLGLCFQKIGWTDEAIETLRGALAGLSGGEETTEFELRYALMEALMARAGEQSLLSDAEEAYKLASAIAIQNIAYKQVRARREEIKAMIAKLKG